MGLRRPAAAAVRLAVHGLARPGRAGPARGRAASTARSKATPGSRSIRCRTATGATLGWCRDLSPTNGMLKTVARLARPVAQFGHDWVLDTGARQFRLLTTRSPAAQALNRAICRPAYAPPSTRIAAPVRNLACSEQTNATTAPKSSGSPTNPAGMPCAGRRGVAAVQRRQPIGGVQARLHRVHGDAVARHLAGDRLQEPGRARCAPCSTGSASRSVGARRST